MELRPAVTPQRTEDVTSQALAVHPHQGVLTAIHIALDQGYVVLAVEHRLVGVHGEVPVVGGNSGIGDTPHQLVLSATVADQVGDGDEMEAVLFGEHR